MKGLFDSFIMFFIAFFGIGTVSTVAAVTSTMTTSGAYNYAEYEESVSATAFMHLSAEASQGRLLKMYTKYMELEDNKIDGWVHIEENTFDNNMSYALWVNEYKNDTYALIYAGTDHIEDTLDYVPMETSEKRSPQMNKAVEVAKTIKGTIAEKHAENPEVYGELNNLYVSGHSLGGYLSMYVVSDMVDSMLGYENVLITLDDIGFGDVTTIDELKTKLQCVTFGAPGVYYTELKLIPTTHWQKQKVEVNEAKHYDEIITQHVNSRDPVGNLFQYKNLKTMRHLGTRKYYEVEKASLNTLTTFFRNNDNKSVVGIIVNAGVAFTVIYYHMPWVYVNVLNGK